MDYYNADCLVGQVVTVEGDTVLIPKSSKLLLGFFSVIKNRKKPSRTSNHLTNKIKIEYKISLFYSKQFTALSFVLTSGRNLNEMNNVNSLGNVFPAENSSDEAIQMQEFGLRLKACGRSDTGPHLACAGWKLRLAPGASGFIVPTKN